jgi:hypothetical protein
MKLKTALAMSLLAVTVVATSCSREPEGLQIATGTEVALEKSDGVTVSGRLVEVHPQEVVLEATDGQRTRVPRAEIKALRTASITPPATPSAAVASSQPSAVGPSQPATPAITPQSSPDNARAAAPPELPAPSALATPAPPPAPTYREVTVPAGTVLPIELRTSVGSETSKVEDQVRGTLRRAITVNGTEVVPSGSEVLGTVTEATRSGRVKGRATVAFRFSRLDVPGDAERVSIRTASIVREAEATKKKDAAKIGGGAAAGAVIGGIIGGGDGAAKGAAIGGGAGTGVVLSTRGKEVVLPAGTDVSTKLTEPLTIRVRVR